MVFSMAKLLYLMLAHLEGLGSTALHCPHPRVHVNTLKDSIGWSCSGYVLLGHAGADLI